MASDLQEWTQRHGLSPGAAAQALGLSRAQVYRHLAGRPLPRRTALLAALYDRDPPALAEISGVNPENRKI